MTKSELANELRDTLADMAATCSVDMRLWDKHSNAVLKSADAIEAYEAALRPFAERVKKSDSEATAMGFAPSFDDYVISWHFSFGELRQARAALEKHNGR